ncbi:hypothetical protein [Schumannella sp. 10F1B-5-1]|uniref:hypothetical protein n=1 Tax=Schumannella sp. 10F1B-5-1 TaxID=2590780 RepID=UPI0011311B59|nr:hypothetical protein [Schumannella sp. 10F1B-5-1]TPW70115.1 hypothetical protein FJ658_13890 [Schumannella sp. 10F1B-5-1]
MVDQHPPLQPGPHGMPPYAPQPPVQPQPVQQQPFPQPPQNPAVPPQYGAPPAYGAAPQLPPTAPHLPPTAPKRRRRVWPWILALVLLLVVVAAAVGIPLAISALNGPTRGAGSPAAAVQGFDRAFEKADCAALKKVTSSAFRSDLYNGDFSCAAFESDAKSYRVDDTYAYSFSVVGSRFVDGGAEVTVDEVDSSSTDPDSYTNVYRLTKNAAGAWVITEVGDAGEQN